MQLVIHREHREPFEERAEAQEAGHFTVHLVQRCPVTSVGVGFCPW